MNRPGLLAAIFHLSCLVLHAQEPVPAAPAAPGAESAPAPSTPAVVAAPAAGVEILEAEGIKVTLSTADGGMTMEKDGQVVMSGVKCGAGGKFTRAEWVMVNEPLGAARALKVHYDNQRSVLMAIFPGRPFWCLRQEIVNAAEADADYGSEVVLEGAVDGPSPVAGMRSFGTAGVTTLKKNTGSFMYQAVVHPASGAGLVAGWVSSDRGSGVFFTPEQGEKPGLQAVTEYGRLRLKPKSAERGEWLCAGWFADARLGLEAYADMVSAYHGVRLPGQPTGYCTWYSSPHGGAGDEKVLPELAAYCGRELKPFGFSFLQIDDKWQIGKERNGPAKDFTGARADGPYPSGMKAAADAIKANGLTPGLWFMPFAGDHEEPIFKPHPEWFLKDAEGKVFETAWGGSSLDMSQPGPQEHLKGLVRRFVKDWGFGYLKMDGLYTGLGVAQVYPQHGWKKDGFGGANPADPYKTAVEVFRDGLKMIRAEAGPATYLLGCCIPQNLRSMGASFGLVDAMRIGPDNEAKWKTDGNGGVLTGPSNGGRRWFMHRRIWHNDPDPIYVRPSLELNEARAMASWTAVSGQLNTHSEWTPGLPPERVEVLKRTMPPNPLGARPVDVFENDPARIWVVRDTRVKPERVIVGIFNWGQDVYALELPVGRLGLDAAQVYEGWEFWSNKQVEPVQGSLKAKLPPASCLVLALRPRGPAPMVISTSRHVMQGVVELDGEGWDAAAKLLRGRLRIVGGDVCEIRVLLPDGGKGWGDGQLVLGEGDAAAGVRASLSRDGAVVRLRLESPDSRELGWSVKW